MSCYVPSSQNASTAEIVRSLGQLSAGRSNATGTVTLRAGQTTTTVNDDNFATGACVVLTPLSANAAAALSGVWFTLNTVGAFVIHHASAASTDRSYAYAIVG